METKELERQISVQRFFDEQLVLENKAPDVCDVILEYMSRSNISKATMIRRLNVERSYGYHMLKGLRVPTRNTLLKIGLLLELTLDELQELLKIGGRASLYARNLEDAKVIYALNNIKNIGFDEACVFIWGEE